MKVPHNAAQCPLSMRQSQSPLGPAPTSGQEVKSTAWPRRHPNLAISRHAR